MESRHAKSGLLAASPMGTSSVSITPTQMDPRQIRLALEDVTMLRRA